MTDRWLTTGEACHALGVSRTTLRAAEEAALISPARTPGGHRRYAAAELHRYLAAAGAAVPPAEDRPAAPDTPAPDLDLAPAVRAAVRPLVHALDAECAGVYLCAGTDPRFAGAFGIPRWLAEQLTDAPAPPEIAAALPSPRARPFEPATCRFPDARSTGQGVAVGLRGDGGPIGVLFLVTRAADGLVPAQLRVVEAYGELLAQLLTAQARATALQTRLTRIAGFCAP